MTHRVMFKDRLMSASGQSRNGRKIASVANELNSEVVHAKPIEDRLNFGNAKMGESHDRRVDHLADGRRRRRPKLAIRRR
jgi:hypothetical protein